MINKTLSTAEQNAETLVIQSYHFWHENYIEKRYDINEPDWVHFQNNHNFECHDYVYQSLSAFLRTLYLCSSCPLKSLKHNQQESCCKERLLLAAPSEAKLEAANQVRLAAW